MCTEDRGQPAMCGVVARAYQSVRRIGLLAGAMLLTAGSLAPNSLAAEATAVRDIRIAAHGDATRVVIDLNRRVSFRHLTLDQPPRLAIDLPEVAWEVPSINGARVTGLVTGLRFGRFRAGVSRIVLDLAQPYRIQQVFELPPDAGHGYRIVTELVAAAAAPQTAGQAVAAEQQQAALAVIPPPNGTAVEPPANGMVILPPPRKQPVPAPRKRVVVIDPGHGGVDPGAVGAGGTYEKDVVLAMGLELRRQLEATGRYTVIMTRESDRIVRLRDRLRVARESDGELFLSLHADSLVRAPDVRGAAVYTLSEQASTQEAARLASKENRADILAGIDLSDQEDIVTEILIDLAQRDANNKSVQVAEQFVSQLKSVTRMARQRRSQAGFVVLKSPDMPSLLIELGYLSNAADEQSLRDPAHVAGLARAMVAAVDQYFAPERS
jgi:N-acetylmuramoyl-L-alanine amidase